MCRHQCRHHLLKWQVPKKTKIIGHKVYNFELVGMKFSSMSLNFHDKINIGYCVIKRVIVNLLLEDTCLISMYIVHEFIRNTIVRNNLWTFKLMCAENSIRSAVSNMVGATAGNIFLNF